MTTNPLHAATDSIIIISTRAAPNHQRGASFPPEPHRNACLYLTEPPPPTHLVQLGLLLLVGGEHGVAEHGHHHRLQTLVQTVHVLTDAGERRRTECQTMRDEKRGTSTPQWQGFGGRWAAQQRGEIIRYIRLARTKWRS